MIRNRAHLQRYLGAAERSFNGAVKSERFHNFTNDRGAGFFPADASAQQAPVVGESQPYIITVSNVSAAAVSNFDVLGAASYLQNVGTGTWSAGSLTISGITISSGIAGVTYQQILAQSQLQPFTVGKLYAYSVAGSASQLVQPMLVITQDANGNLAQKPLIPRLAPNQYQSSAIETNQPFRVDGLTILRFSTILASVVFQIQLFPVDNINLSRGLAGNDVAAQFVPPTIAYK